MIFLLIEVIVNYLKVVNSQSLSKEKISMEAEKTRYFATELSRPILKFATYALLVGCEYSSVLETGEWNTEFTPEEMTSEGKTFFRLEH